MTMAMISTTPAVTVRPGDVKMAPMLGIPFILLMGLVNLQLRIVRAEASSFNGRTLEFSAA